MESFTDTASLQSTTNNTDLNSHTDIHTVGISYKCDQCDLFFLDKSALLEHVQSSICDIDSNCNNKTASHTGDCDKNISKGFDFKTYHQVYNCDKPDTCRKCDKAFSINNTTDHQRTDISGKPYKCMYCDKSFSVKSGLIRHIRTHTGEKPYQCSECHKAFADNSTLI